MNCFLYTFLGLARRSEKQYPLLSGQLLLKGCFQRGKQCISNSASAGVEQKHLSLNVRDPHVAKQRASLFGLSMATMLDYLTLMSKEDAHFSVIRMFSGTPAAVTITSNLKADICIVSLLNRFLVASFFPVRLFIIKMATNGTTARQICW